MAEDSKLMMHFKLGRYFERGSHKVALSLPELVSQTNNFSVKNRPGCQPTLLHSKPTELFLDYNVKCSLAKSDPNGHDVKVRFNLDKVVDEATAKDLDVAVNCSCPAFLYWGGQFNSHQRDALEGEPRPLLTAPTERLDLRDGFVICKHIKAVSERILPSVQFNIGKILTKREVEKNKLLQRNAPPSEEHKKKMRERLEERQREMRERQEKKKLQQNKNKRVRKQLEKGIEKREEDLVGRSTPATPEEQERVPVVEPIAPAHPLPPMTPIEDLDEEFGNEPIRHAPRPQPSMPKISPQEQAALDELEEDERLAEEDRLIEQESKRYPKDWR